MLQGLPLACSWDSIEKTVKLLHGLRALQFLSIQFTFIFMDAKNCLFFILQFHVGANLNPLTISPYMMCSHSNLNRKILTLIRKFYP